MKTIIIKLLQVLVANKSIFLKLKDTVFCNPAEHLYRVTKYSHKYYSGKLHLPIIDIGAADGQTAAFFAQNFPNSTVIGYEPISKMFQIAQKANEKNKRIIVKQIALYNSVGENSINITANYLSSSINNLNSSEIYEQADEHKKKFEIIEKQKIVTSTLDEETKNLEEIFLIKIDTQGTELDILNCGVQALKKTHLLLIEMSNHGLYQNGCQYYEVDQFLRKHDFRLVDTIVVYRPDGIMQEYDAIYENIAFKR